MVYGGCEISFCVGERGMDWGCLGDCVKVPFMSTDSYVYKWVTFLYVQSILEKQYYLWTIDEITTIVSLLSILVHNVLNTPCPAISAGNKSSLTHWTVKIS